MCHQFQESYVNDSLLPESERIVLTFGKTIIFLRLNLSPTPRESFLIAQDKSFNLTFLEKNKRDIGIKVLAPTFLENELMYLTGPSQGLKIRGAL